MVKHFNKHLIIPTFYQKKNGGKGRFWLTVSLLFILSSKSLTPIIPLRHMALQPTKPIWQSKKGSPIIRAYKRKGSIMNLNLNKNFTSFPCRISKLVETSLELWPFHIYSPQITHPIKIRNILLVSVSSNLCILNDWHFKNINPHIHTSTHKSNEKMKE